MAFAIWQQYITDGEDVVPGADVEVRLESNGALATIYDDRAGNSTKSNPFQADAEGLARFYAAGALYKITATKDSFSSTFRNEPIGTARSYDVGNAAAKLLTRSTADGRYLFKEDQNIDFKEVTGDFTLVSSDNNKTLYIKTDVTIILPVWADQVAGYAVEVVFAGNYTVTLTTQSSDTILDSDTTISTNGAIYRTPETDKWGTVDIDNYLAIGDKVSNLTNDANYVAKNDPVSDLNNDAGYLTQADTRPDIKTDTNTSYTYVLDDEDTFIQHDNSSAISVTVPTGSSVGFALGTVLLGEQTNTGQVTITGDTGVTVESAGGANKTANQYSQFSLLKIGTDEWRLSGDLTV